jgi:hypothetical protein
VLWRWSARSPSSLQVFLGFYDLPGLGVLSAAILLYTSDSLYSGPDPCMPYAGTIEDNIAYGRYGRCSREEVEEAARAANAHDFISGAGHIELTQGICFCSLADLHSNAGSLHPCDPDTGQMLQSCRRGTPRRWATEAACCRAGSASALPSHAH